MNAVLIVGEVIIAAALWQLWTREGVWTAFAVIACVIAGCTAVSFLEGYSIAKWGYSILRHKRVSKLGRPRKDKDED